MIERLFLIQGQKWDPIDHWEVQLGHSDDKEMKWLSKLSVNMFCYTWYRSDLIYMPAESPQIQDLTSSNDNTQFPKTLEACLRYGFPAWTDEYSCHGVGAGDGPKVMLIWPAVLQQWGDCLWSPFFEDSTLRGSQKLAFDAEDIYRRG